MTDLVKYDESFVGTEILVKLVGGLKRGWFLVTTDGRLVRISDLNADYIARRLDGVVRISQSSSVKIDLVDLTQFTNSSALDAAREVFSTRHSVMSRMTYDQSCHRIAIACEASDATDDEPLAFGTETKETVYVVDLDTGTSVQVAKYSNLKCIRWSARGDLCCTIQTAEGLSLESRNYVDRYGVNNIETLHLDWNDFGPIRDIAIAGEANEYISIVHEVESESDRYATQETLTVIACKTGSRRELGPIGLDAYVAWCPTGTKGVVVGPSEAGSPLLVLDVQSGQRHALLNVHEGDELGEISYPTCNWLDDQRHVTCPSFLGSATAVYIVDVYSNEVRELMRIREALVGKAIPIGI